MAPQLNTGFWTRMVAAWSHVLAEAQRLAIEGQVVMDVADGMAELKRHDTFRKIPSALDAILADDDDDDEEGMD